ncbi:MAG: hypothetical protein U9O87_02500 [Verrucomicrobiota bacterium]|nr:hypothetical protein [Verrucomicrobiota bacterium]
MILQKNKDAPEQSEGAMLDSKTDIFSLGLTLYSLLTCSDVFRSKGMKNRIKKNRECIIPPPEKRNPTAQISEQLSQIIMKSLEKILENVMRVYMNLKRNF